MIFNFDFAKLILFGGQKKEQKKFYRKILTLSKSEVFFRKYLGKESGQNKKTIEYDLNLLMRGRQNNCNLIANPDTHNCRIANEVRQGNTEWGNACIQIHLIDKSLKNNYLFKKFLNFLSNVKIVYSSFSA